MRVTFIAVVALGVLIGSSQSDEDESILSRIIDYLTKQLFAALIDKYLGDPAESDQDENDSIPSQFINYLTQQLYDSKVELFNSDPRIDDIFRNIFRLVQKYLLEKGFEVAKYRLYSPRNITDEKVLKFNNSSLDASGFNSSLETKLLIHGYTVELLETSVFFDLKDRILMSGNFNVILVDWTDYNHAPYQNALGFAYLVACDLANLMDFLQNNTDANAESFHIIGHSMGAHIAGIAGKLISNLGRITSLDAAGPVFQILPNYLKLSRTDAKFVDAMHTNGRIISSKGFGLLDSYGDEDFFPNGGSIQSGCEEGRIYMDSDGRNVTVNSTTEVSCSHSRAPQLFLASIDECRFLSVLCRSYEDYLNGSCSNQVAEMGFHAKPMASWGGKFYLTTTDRYPYCSPSD